MKRLVDITVEIEFTVEIDDEDFSFTESNVVSHLKDAVFLQVGGWDIFEIDEHGVWGRNLEEDNFGVWATSGRRMKLEVWARVCFQSEQGLMRCPSCRSYDLRRVDEESVECCECGWETDMYEAMKAGDKK